MEFEINGTKWTIEEIDANRMKEEAGNDYILGLTVYKPQKVYLVNDQANIIDTLKHELMHVWLSEHAHSQNNMRKFHFEEVCELVAKSNSFINEIVNKYKEAKNEEKSIKRTRKDIHTRTKESGKSKRK